MAANPLRAALVAIALGLAGCASAAKSGGAASGGPSGLGLGKTTPIEVCSAKGEQEYLARLRCADGSRPEVGHRSSVGLRDPFDSKPAQLDEGSFKRSMDPNRKLEAGERDPHIVDAFPLSCGGTKLTVYLDMYHCAAAAPREAPEGFLFSPEP